MELRIEGIMPPIATPFTDGRVAHDKLRENFARWNKTGLAGYVVFGSNGEAVDDGGNYLFHKQYHCSFASMLWGLLPKDLLRHNPSPAHLRLGTTVFPKRSGDFTQCHLAFISGIW